MSTDSELTGIYRSVASRHATKASHQDRQLPDRGRTAGRRVEGEGERREVLRPHSEPLQEASPPQEMNNFPFVLWLLGFPLVDSIGNYLHWKRGRRYSDEVECLSTVIELVIWISVAHFLYV